MRAKRSRGNPAARRSACPPGRAIRDHTIPLIGGSATLHGPGPHFRLKAGATPKATQAYPNGTGHFSRNISTTPTFALMAIVTGICSGGSACRAAVHPCSSRPSKLAQLSPVVSPPAQRLPAPDQRPQRARSYWMYCPSLQRPGVYLRPLRLGRVQGISLESDPGFKRCRNCSENLRNV